MGTRTHPWWWRCSLSSWGYEEHICQDSSSLCLTEYKRCLNILKSKLKGSRILFKTWLLSTLASCQIFLFVVSFIKTKTHSWVLPSLGIQIELSRGPRVAFHWRSEVVAVVNTHWVWLCVVMRPWKDANNSLCFHFYLKYQLPPALTL